MTSGAGAVRTRESLEQTAQALAALYEGGPSDDPGPESWETTNLLHVGQVLTHAATLREETRGGHMRSDHPETDDQHWRGHLLLTRGPDGRVTTTFQPVEEAR
jgi:L-aspartate oxidase